MIHGSAKPEYWQARFHDRVLNLSSNHTARYLGDEKNEKQNKKYPATRHAVPLLTELEFSLLQNFSFSNMNFLDHSNKRRPTN
jgi:hypothetical protein